MKIQVTAHAVDRYVDRIDDRATQAEARELIRHAMTVATKQREKTRSGHTKFRAGDLRLIVAEEPGRTVVVTVLGPNDPDGEVEQAIPELAAELAEQYREGQAERGKVEQLLAKLRTKASPEVPRAVAANERLQTELAAAVKRAERAERMLEHGTASQGVELARWKAKFAKQLGHAERMAADREALKKLIGPLVVVALGVVSPAAEAALAAVEAERPGWVASLRAAGGTA